MLRIFSTYRVECDLCGKQSAPVSCYEPLNKVQQERVSAIIASIHDSMLAYVDGKSIYACKECRGKKQLSQPILPFAAFGILSEMAEHTVELCCIVKEDKPVEAKVPF